MVEPERAYNRSTQHVRGGWQVMRGKCKLCQRDADLRQSHIIPEFCYAQTYDQVGSGRARMLSSDTSRTKLLQKGLRDRLLCDVCEGHLNDEYEKPFHRVW